MWTKRIITLGAIAVLTATAFVQPAQAGATGRRNTMIGLGAVAAYGLLTDQPDVAIAGAVGTGIAYHNYRLAKHREAAWSYYRRHGHHHRYRGRESHWRDRDHDSGRGHDRGRHLGWQRGRHNPHRDWD